MDRCLNKGRFRGRTLEHQRKMPHAFRLEAAHQRAGHPPDFHRAQLFLLARSNHNQPLGRNPGRPVKNGDVVKLALKLAARAQVGKPAVLFRQGRLLDRCPLWLLETKYRQSIGRHLFGG